MTIAYGIIKSISKKGVEILTMRGGTVTAPYCDKVNKGDIVYYELSPNKKTVIRIKGDLHEKWVETPLTSEEIELNSHFLDLL